MRPTLSDSEMVSYPLHPPTEIAMLSPDSHRFVGGHEPRRIA